MITCWQCGRDNEAFFKFCLGCGAELAAAPAEEVKPEPTPAAAEPARPATDTVVTRVEAEPTPAAKPAAAAERKCRSCGATVLPGYKFCANCGTLYEDRDPGFTKPVVDVRDSDGRGAQVGELVLIRPDQSTAASFPIFEGTNSVGRDGTDIAFPEDTFLAAHHLDIVIDNGSMRARPHESLNGTFIRLKAPTPLEHGDEVRIGQELLRLELTERGSALELAGPGGEDTHGSPKPEGMWGRMCVMSGKERPASAYLLVVAENLLGREYGNITFPHDGFVSGRHAVVRREVSGEVVIEDVGSRNGTFVRIKREIEVGAGDYFLAGQQLFRIQV